MQWMGIWIHHHFIIKAGGSPDLGKQPKSWVTAHCWSANHTTTQALRLMAHPEWITHPCHTYMGCLTTFICNEWAYGSITTSLSRQVVAQIWESSQNPGSLLVRKSYHNTSIEAHDPPRVDHTSMSYIYKVFDNLHMQWMGIWIHHHFIFTAGAIPDLGNQPKSLMGHS